MSRSADYKNIYIQKYASPSVKVSFSQSIIPAIIKPGINPSWNGLKDCSVFFTLSHMLVYEWRSLKTIQQFSKILGEEEEPVLRKGLHGDPADIRNRRPFSK